jgi:acetyl-CoA carboxylase carboxyltransferase component
MAARVFEAIDEVIAKGERPRAAFQPRTRLRRLHRQARRAQYDVRDVIACMVDARTEPNATGTNPSPPTLTNTKPSTASRSSAATRPSAGTRAASSPTRRRLVQRTVPGGKAGPSKAVQMPGVIYDDSADKAARFIMDCNQRKIPLVFLHDTTGFMVGRDSEQGGIIRAGAKMVNAMANCVVPKIVVIIGGSYGAGNYAMCGRAFDQFLAFAWPSAKCAVMGANQATGVLVTIEEASRKRKGERSTPRRTSRSTPRSTRRTPSRPTSATPPPAAGSTASSSRTRPATN